MKTILLSYAPDELSANVVAQFQALAPEARILVTKERAEIEAALDDIEIAFRTLPYDLMRKAPKLRWFQQWNAGVEWLHQQPEIAASDLIITNASGIHAIPISEHILAMLLSFARGLPTAIRLQTQNKWESPDGLRTIFELPGKTMVLIGVGAIGERTALLAHAHGMRVLGVRRDPTQLVPGVEAMYSTAHLRELLPIADVVVLTVPITAETRHLIGERELRSMKPSTYLINIGRGATVDQPALIRALQEGWIAGAGLDVFDPEPLPADSPLWGMKNVIITAHYSGNTPEYENRAIALFLDNLRRYQAGEPLRNVVDKRLGY